MMGRLFVTDVDGLSWSRFMRARYEAYNTVFIVPFIIPFIVPFVEMSVVPY